MENEVKGHRVRASQDGTETLDFILSFTGSQTSGCLNQENNTQNHDLTYIFNLVSGC